MKRREYNVTDHDKGEVKSNLSSGPRSSLDDQQSSLQIRDNNRTRDLSQGLADFPTDGLGMLFLQQRLQLLRMRLGCQSSCTSRNDQ